MVVGIAFKSIHNIDKRHPMGGESSGGKDAPPRKVCVFYTFQSAILNENERVPFLLMVLVVTSSTTDEICSKNSPSKYSQTC